MQQPNPLAITLLCIGGAALLVFLFWLNHALRTGGKRAERKPAQVSPWISLGLSYLLGGTGPVKSSDDGARDIMTKAQEAAPDRPSAAASSQWGEPPKIPETNQPEPNEPAVREPPDDPIIISHKMTKKELTVLLAVQKDDEGAYRFSANQIAGFVGGTSAETKGWVAEVRGTRERAPNTMRRPVGGWGKAS